MPRTLLRARSCVHLHFACTQRRNEVREEKNDAFCRTISQSELEMKRKSYGGEFAAAGLWCVRCAMEDVDAATNASTASSSRKQIKQRYRRVGTNET